jgi:putative intracellular protease/amidase
MIYIYIYIYYIFIHLFIFYFFRFDIQVQVTIAGLNGPQTITCSRHVKVIPDVGLNELSEQEISDFDVLVLPGGIDGARAFEKVCMDTVLWKGCLFVCLFV